MEEEPPVPEVEARSTDITVTVTKGEQGVGLSLGGGARMYLLLY